MCSLPLLAFLGGRWRLWPRARQMPRGQSWWGWWALPTPALPKPSSTGRNRKAALISCRTSSSCNPSSSPCCCRKATALLGEISKAPTEKLKQPYASTMEALLVIERA
eukprot:11474073-Alexandrium_andersonii.AAC.1